MHACMHACSAQRLLAVCLPLKSLYLFCCAVVTVLHLVVVAFIIIAGLCKANASNMQPFLLDGPRGVFDGAALVRPCYHPHAKY